MVSGPRRPTVSVDEPLTTNAEANAVYADVYAALTRKGISVNVPAGDYTPWRTGTPTTAYSYTRSLIRALISRLTEYFSDDVG